MVKRLKKGADIGCKGAGRLPTSKPNSASAIEYGDRLADSLQDWIKSKLAFGPLLQEEMPWQDYTVNPLLVKLKPDGKARICINMSAPHSKPGDPEDIPKSVNEGIDADMFKASMSSTKSFRSSLMMAGCPAVMCKLDWKEV